MKKSMVLSGIVSGLMVMAAQNGWAGEPGERLRKADKNDDGLVTRGEARRATAKGYSEKKSDVNNRWEALADLNKDGKIDDGEAVSYGKKAMDANGDGKVDGTERDTFWGAKKSKVSTEVEKKFDANGDGSLEAKEAREMMKDRLALIKSEGKAKVDSPIEKEFDLDNDGIISGAEAKMLQDAVGE
jgi:hypothetical protein